MWKIYLEEDFNKHSKQDYYLAAIVAKIHECFSSKNSPKVKVSQFLLKFIVDKKKPKKAETVEEATKRSKRFWFNMVGLK